MQSALGSHTIQPASSVTSLRPVKIWMSHFAKIASVGKKDASDLSQFAGFKVFFWTKESKVSDMNTLVDSL